MGVQLAKLSDTAEGETLRAWLGGSALPAFGDRVFPTNVAVARAAARLQPADPAPFRDSFIAASASYTE